MKTLMGIISHEEKPSGLAFVVLSFRLVRNLSGRLLTLFSGRKDISVALLAFLIAGLLWGPPSTAADKPGFRFSKQPELQQIRPKKPVRIKLRRTAKEEYTWELSGDDAEEIVQTDRRLRKMLNTK